MTLNNFTKSRMFSQSIETHIGIVLFTVHTKRAATTPGNAHTYMKNVNSLYEYISTYLRETKGSIFLKLSAQIRSSSGTLSGDSAEPHLEILLCKVELKTQTLSHLKSRDWKRKENVNILNTTFWSIIYVSGIEKKIMELSYILCWQQRGSLRYNSVITQNRFSFKMWLISPMMS